MLLLHYDEFPEQHSITTDRYTLMMERGAQGWWRAKLLSPKHFESLLERVRPFVRSEHCAPNMHNRMLLTVEWLVSYATAAVLAAEYGVSESTAWRTIVEFVTALSVVVQSSCNDLADPIKHAAQRCLHLPL